MLQQRQSALVHLVVQNVIPLSILHTSSTAGLIPGIVATLIIGVGAWAITSVLCIRDMRKGAHFEYGDMPSVPEFDGDKKPNFFIALLPMIVVFILFAFVKLDISIALSAGIIVALVLMGRFVKYAGLPEGTKRGGKILATVNEGAMTSAGALFNISVISGFAAVVAATTAFQTMAGSIVNLPIHPILIVVVAIVILVALTSSPPAGMTIILPILASALLAGGSATNAGILTPEMIHRVATIASVSFETLPFNGMIVIILSMTKLSHKEGYMPMFLISCILPLIAAIVAALMYIVAPSLS